MYVFISGFIKTLLISTPPAWGTTLNHPQAVCQHIAYPPTLLVSGWLVLSLSTCRELTLSQSSPVTKISVFFCLKWLSLWPTLPHPVGVRTWDPHLVFVCPDPHWRKLPLAFAAPQRHACQGKELVTSLRTSAWEARVTPAGRGKIDTVFINSNICKFCNMI